jgi:hemoglobin
MGHRVRREHHLLVTTLFEAMGGAAGVQRLADAWHARLLADEVAAHPFRRGIRVDHTQRLAAYWSEILGGPATYSRLCGDQSSVVRMHSGNGDVRDLDEHAVACFDQALTDTGLADDQRLRRTLHDWFVAATAETTERYPRSADDVPDGLPMPRWSWDGPVRGN